jgi:PPP family 3-phenylpropionic acid transporter
MPYWSLYLQTIGFNAQAIGELTAIMTVSRIFAPLIWGWVADHTGRHITLVRLSSFLALLCFLGVLVKQTYWWLATVLAIFSFFWSAALPQFETVTLAHLGTQSHRYSHIRLWGSIGFIITVISLGGVFQYVNVTLLPTLLIGLFANIWLISLLIPEGPTTAAILSTHTLWQILKRPAVIALLMVCFLMQVSHGPYYTFYTIYLESHGYTRDIIGQLWALGVIAEVGIFMVLHQLLKRFSLRHLLIVTLILSGGRWLLIGSYVEWGWVLFFAQLLHAASFGLFHGVAIQFIRHYFADRHQGRGQALYSGLGFGAGSAVGSLMSGYTWERLGPQVSYDLAAVICVVAVLIGWWAIEDS